MITGERPCSALNVRLIVENRIQQRGVHFDSAIVGDEAELAESVHEKADAGARRADHLGERFLTDFCDRRLRIAVLAEIREDQEEAGPASSRWN